MIDTDNTTAAATATSKLCNSIGEWPDLVIAHLSDLLLLKKRAGIYTGSGKE